MLLHLLSQHPIPGQAVLRGGCYTFGSPLVLSHSASQSSPPHHVANFIKAQCIKHGYGFRLIEHKGIIASPSVSGLHSSQLTMCCCRRLPTNKIPIYNFVNGFDIVPRLLGDTAVHTVGQVTPASCQDLHARLQCTSLWCSAHYQAAIHWAGVQVLHTTNCAAQFMCPTCKHVS